MKNKSADRREQPSAFERIEKIGQRLNELRASGFDAGHEVLLRFLDDLRDYMEWPSDAAGDTHPPWQLKTVNDGIGSHDYRLKFHYKKSPVRGESIFQHKCTLRVRAPNAGVETLVEFDLKKGKSATAPEAWTIVIGDKPIVVDIDASDYSPPPEDALKEAAKRIGRALYFATWNR